MPTKDRSTYRLVQYNVKTNYPIPATSVTSRETKKITRTSDGGLLPNWQDVVRKHGNATTAFSGVFQSIESGQFYAYVNVQTSAGQLGHPRVYNESVSGDIALYGNSFPTGTYGSQAEAQNTAYIRWNKKLQNEFRAIEGGVLIGELRETMRMLRSPAKALLGKLDKYVTHVSKRNRGNGNKSSIKKVIADSWLEHSFGWKPFINDIADAHKLYSRLGQKEMTVKVTSGASAKKQVVGTVSAGATYANQVQVLWTERHYEESHSRIKGEILVSAVTNTSSILQQAGLTFDQFIPTAWELLPWSFLVDYFTNIGDILAYDTKVYSNLAWHCVGSRTDLVKEIMVRPNEKAMQKTLGIYYVGGGGTPCKVKLIRRTIARGVDGYLTSYKPRFQFDVSLSDNQLINIAALLASANRSSPQRFKP